MNVLVRPCLLSDIPAVSVPFTRGYNFPENQEKMLTFYWFLQPDGWWIGFKDDIPCAFGGAVDYGPFSYIGMLAVDPTLQNQGIGTAVMRHIVDWGKQRSCPTLLLEANLKTVSLYKRLGFVEEELTLELKRTANVSTFERASNVKPFEELDITEVASFDAPYFGVRREKILAAYLRSNPGRAFISRDNSGEITGYIFGKANSLGPWIAKTIEDAEKLLQYVLTLSFKSEPSITLPSSNHIGTELLKSYGFSESVPSMYMRLGPPITSIQRPFIYGQTSMALG